jgi:hypothetical protein
LAFSGRAEQRSNSRLSNALADQGFKRATPDTSPLPAGSPAGSARTQQGAFAHRPCCHTRRPGRWPQVCGAVCPRTTGHRGDSRPCTAVTQSRCSGPGLSPTQSSCSSPELSPAAPMQTEYIVEDMLGLILVGSIMNASNGRHIGRNKYWTSNGPNLGLTIEILLGL